MKSLNLRLFFYLLILFPAIAYTLEVKNKSQKSKYFIKHHKDITYMKDPNGVILELKALKYPDEQVKGLSGISRKSLKTNQGALFIYGEMAPRGFWMPDTYFDLAIIFLDRDFKVVHIEKKATSHPGMKEPPIIYRTKVVEAMYVIEVPADNPSVFSINVGDKYKVLKNR